MNNTNTLINGRNSVMEALVSGRSFEKILIKDGETEGSIKSICSKAIEMGIKIEKINKKALDNLAESHQGIVAFVSPISYRSIPDILQIAKKKNEQPFILILNNIKDPHNFGAIIRSAEAAGVHGIIIPSRRAVGITATVEKTSAGAVNYITICKVPNIVQAIEYLKRQNVWIVGADIGGVSCFNIDFRIPVAICIGGEGEGISHLVAKKCDYITQIPMHGRIQTYNASVAGAIIMYEVVKQRYN